MNHAKLRDWRAAVANAMTARERPHGASLGQARLLPPPPAGSLRDRAQRSGAAPLGPLVPQTKPDIDKLVRACLDALTGMAFRDDSQVAMLQARKFFADERQPGVHIEIEER